MNFEIRYSLFDIHYSPFFTLGTLHFRHFKLFSVLVPWWQKMEKLVREATVEIKNTDGLHMRPAMQFVGVASRFESDIAVSNCENTVDGKSIMQMSMLAATCGTKLKIKAEGRDAQEALDALRELVEDKHFDEPTPKEKNKQ
jgi:phosphocarrier protein